VIQDERKNILNDISSYWEDVKEYFPKVVKGVHTQETIRDMQQILKHMHDTLEVLKEGALKK
jgi:hypothetical protein